MITTPRIILRCAVSGLTIAVSTVLVGGRELAAQNREMPKDGPDVYTVRSGLKYSVLRAGDGERHPQIGDIVNFHCSTWLADGTLCELRRARPMRLTLGVGMPKAWVEGLMMMTAGAKFKFVVPPFLGYGKVGSPGKPPDVPGVPPDATLVLSMELVSSEKGVALPEFQLPDLMQQKVTSSGMKFEVLRQGHGKKPTKGERYTIEFTLFNERGQLVSTSLAPEVRRMVGRVGGDHGRIPFLPEAIGMMRVGERLRLEVPAELCYGRRGNGHLVPPNSTTFWELELLRLDPAPAPRSVPKFRRLSRFKARHTKSGLRYEVVEPGSGQRPKLTDSVEVHYAGWGVDGKLFDETFTAGVPLELPVGKTVGSGAHKLTLVKGLREGILLMPVGAVYRFAIPASLGYGLQGLKSRGIGPEERLYFFVELVSIVNDRR